MPSASRGRHPGPHPRPHHCRAVEKPSVLHQPPGRHRRRHPARRRGRPTVARQPQRLQGVGGIRGQGRRRQNTHDLDGPRPGCVRCVRRYGWTGAAGPPCACPYSSRRSSPRHTAASNSASQVANSVNQSHRGPLRTIRNPVFAAARVGRVRPCQQVAVRGRDLWGEAGLPVRGSDLAVESFVDPMTLAE